MLSSLFSSSRPIGYTIIALLLFSAYGLNLAWNLDWLQDPIEIINKVALLIAMIFTVFLVQFITIKNQLHGNTLFPLFFYACFLLLFSTYMDNAIIIVSNLFVLLGLRRVFSLPSLRVPKQKIFDAAFWILAACLFNFWTILFLFMVYIAILWFVSEDYRNWLIAIVVTAMMGVLCYTYTLYMNIDFATFWQEKATYSFNFYYFQNNIQRVALSIFASMCCLFIYGQVRLLKFAAMHQTTLYKNILLCFVTGLIIYLLQAPKINAGLVYTFFPLAVSAGNFVQSLNQKWLKEVILTGTLVICVLLFLLQL